MILIEKADDLGSFLKDNFKAIFTVLIIIAGLVVGIILANNPQILKSRADTDTLVIGGNGNTQSITTNSTNIQVDFHPEDFSGN